MVEWGDQSMTWRPLPSEALQELAVAALVAQLQVWLKQVDPRSILGLDEAVAAIEARAEELGLRPVVGADLPDLKDMMERATAEMFVSFEEDLDD